MTTQSVNSQEAQDPPKSREVRLGLVMYGGVSLAVYINGVAHEFFHAVRGRGIYKLIKALTDSDIIVDIISGTSAGGINGIVLAYALCNNKDFTSSANLWRRDGDIRSMLRSPNRGIESTQSLLNSEGYYQSRLEDAFRYMPTYVPESEAEIPSMFNELDLFVTGTDVDGNIFTQFDDAGHPIDVKDHRSVFLLKHRAGRKEPFNPRPDYEEQANEEVTYRALAKLARITSCFPAAFAPVLVTNGEIEEDQRLQTWGKLTKESCFLDGGVIDNKPFTYALKAIFNRVADRRVDRKLFYIEPDPEHFSKLEAASQPNIIQAIIASLIGIPGYESIADDLTLLARHNSKLNQYRRIISSLSSDIKSIEASPVEIEKLYLPSRLIAIRDRVVEGLFKVNGKSDLLDQETRQAGAALIHAFDKLHGDPKKAHEILEAYDVYFRLRRLFRLTYVIEAELRKDYTNATKYKELWQRINQQIKLLDIIRVRMESLIDEAPIEWKTRIISALKNKTDVEKEAEAIWAMVELTLQKLLHEDLDLAQMVPDGYAESLNNKAVWPDQEHLSQFNDKLKSLADNIIANLQDNSLMANSSSAFANLLNKSDAYEKCILDPMLNKETAFVFQAYENFYSIDVHLFPIELMADLHEKDIIETIRISPRDAEKGFSNKGLSDKVSGDALYHFGGFFKRSWRSNDILWGRLDGLCQLVEALLTPQIVEEIVNNEKWRDKVRCRFLKDAAEDENQAEWMPALDPAKLFPQAGKETHKVCREWLGKLLSDEPDKRNEALEKKNFNKKPELIIEAAQLEILNEEIPNVIADALGEQAQWNQFRLSVTDQEQILIPDMKRQIKKKLSEEDAEEAWYTDPSPFGYQPAGGKLDPFIAVLAATGRAESVMEKLKEKDTSPSRPSKTRLGRFFKNQYEVGTEDLLRDMPTLILLEILAVSLLVLRNCLLGVLGNKAAQIKQNPLYIFMVDYPLRVFYSLVLFLRRAPRAWKFLIAALAVISVLALLVGWNWRNAIIYSRGSFSLLWFAIFIALPFLILTTEAIFLWRGKLTSRKWTYSLRGLVIAVFIAALILANLIIILAIVGFEAGNNDLRNLISSRMSDYEGFSAWSEEFRRQIAQVIVIVIALIALLTPYLGGLLWFHWGSKRRAGARDLQKILEDYFNVDDLERITRKLVGSEMVECKHLPQILELYGGDGTINAIEQKIKPYQEVECARLQEVLKDYLPTNRLREVEKKLGVSLSADNQPSFWETKVASKKIEQAKLREVLED